MALGEKERLLREVDKEREVWRQRDRALSTVLQEKDQVTQNLRQELERCQVLLVRYSYFQFDCLMGVSLLDK